MKEEDLRAIIGRAIRGDLYEGLTPPVVDDEVYGAYWIDPALLTIQCLFANQAELEEAKTNGTCNKIRRRIKKALRREGYPEKGIKGTTIGFGSQEDVESEGGSWRSYR